MATAKKGLHLVNAALDEIATEKGNQIVLRGVIDPEHLGRLRVADYQREALPISALTSMWHAIGKGESVPDLELAMRGHEFHSKDDEFWLEDDVYIIDGQQRRNAALHALKIDPKLSVRVGAMIHFGTTQQWERERFRILNMDRIRVSPNVLLKNMRHSHDSVLTLWGLSHSDPKFALRGKVCWRQRVGQDELVTARALLVTAGSLHQHVAYVRARNIGDMAPTIDKQANLVGLQTWRQNVIEFFDLVDEAWGLRTVTHYNLCIQAKVVFLQTLAEVIDEHMEFWKAPNHRALHINTEWTNRFKAFHLRDPSIRGLVAEGTAAINGPRGVLKSLLIQHLNKGKHNRLTTFKEVRDALTPKTFSSIEVRREVEDIEYPGKSS